MRTEKVNERTPTENDNSQLPRKPTFAEVDELAAELCNLYSNHKYYSWYCKTINVLGESRVKEIVSMYDGLEHAKNLFSIRAKQEMNALLGNTKLHRLKSRYGKKKS